MATEAKRGVDDLLTLPFKDIALPHDQAFRALQRVTQDVYPPGGISFNEDEVAELYSPQGPSTFRHLVANVLLKEGAPYWFRQRPYFGRNRQFIMAGYMVDTTHLVNPQQFDYATAVAAFVQAVNSVPTVDPILTTTDPLDFVGKCLGWARVGMRFGMDRRLSTASSGITQFERHIIHDTQPALRDRFVGGFFAGQYEQQVSLGTNIETLISKEDYIKNGRRAISNKIIDRISSQN